MFWFLFALILGYILGKFFSGTVETFAAAIAGKIKSLFSKDDDGDPPAFVG